ncbi:MAG: hypothetical protein Q9M76_00695 [Candidatus Dojkabacteria bacterium]|nr:hypothetical protein [Candidatus Dojkabacteria bacterium]
MNKLLTKALIILLAFSFLTTIIPNFTSIDNTIEADDTDTADLEQELRDIEAQRRALQLEQEEIQNKINENNYLIEGYNDQASSLWGEIQIFQKDIDILALEINEIEISIEALNGQIEKKLAKIEVSEGNISEMETESDKRIVSSYKNFRVYGHDLGSGSSFLNVDEVNDYFKDTKYRDIIQSDANQIINDLHDLREELRVKKADLEENLIEVKKERENIESRKLDLDTKKAEIQAKWSTYESEINNIANRNAENQNLLFVISQEDIDLNTRAERIREEIFNTFTPPSDGEYVTAGRPIGTQGCTGLCTGAHLHFIVWDYGNYQDPCGYLPSGNVAGCGWGNSLDWPIGSAVFTSGYGSRCFNWGGQQYCDWHNGADFAGPAGSTIFSAHDGWLYYGWDPYGAHYAIICQNADCNTGIKTGYWHMQ